MSYNIGADGIHTKKLCSRLSSSEVRFCHENGRLAFETPFRGLGATYDDYLNLIGKRVVNFLRKIPNRISLEKVCYKVSLY